ncbi:MAG: flagellar hook-basal body complex protein FliE [Methylobacteriaceae bacterium]|nr:flagellar hook-basal body complex protein FliE [Methylobacteriaceae bacterium]
MTPIALVSAAPALVDAATRLAPDVATSSAGFAEFVARTAQEAAAALGAADAAAIQGVNGAASLQEVVGKLMAAERTLQTAIALRDRFVASLQEVSRMQI